MKHLHFTVTDRFMAAFHVGLVAKALHGIAVHHAAAIDDATPVVKNGALLMDPTPTSAPPPWDEWLQQLPPVDGWTSTASWMAQHGMGDGQ
ncbi:hypothetical protein [Nocardia sp. NBC_00511]|uniref:hypothetical protein n=1 Tax=Nocardia sp. NBC_00511 TaxID=2903591 RepID=UPI0030E3D70F